MFMRALVRTRTTAENHVTDILPEDKVKQLPHSKKITWIYFYSDGYRVMIYVSFRITENILSLLRY